MSENGNKVTLSDVERIKRSSGFLRGTIVASLEDDATGAIADDDTQLTKFHGIYQQDDRDVRAERQQQKLEPAYSFMVRVRVPGGVCTPQQWLALDQLARDYGGNALRLTTRQAFQFHGIIKRDLKTTMQGINASLLDTLAACGDVNRNVMCTPLAEASPVHAAALRWAQKISDHLSPATGAYHEIWLDGARITEAESEPIYGPTYLPRKFKIAIAIPPQNDVDVFAHDLGFIAIERNGKLVGFNVTVGGGMGATHNDPATYPRLADVIGYCTPAQVTAVAEAVVTIQRDFGDRSERKHARLKYTIADRGVDWFCTELARRTGYSLLPPAPYSFTTTGDRYGWLRGSDGRWHLGLYVPNGRIVDRDGERWLTGLAEIARQHDGEFRLTPNQNVIVSGVADDRRDRIDSIVTSHGIDLFRQLSPVELNAMACVALPTCGLAMAEAERYLPDLLHSIRTLLDDHGIDAGQLVIRMTGCPNGCARPYLADIGLVGKAPGRYNLFVGGGDSGQRLNRLHGENLDEAAILATLDELFGGFVAGRRGGESFGEWAARLETAA